MPANLSHSYLNAEKQYRRASTLVEELACLELMLREIPKHKGTDKLQADLKRKISQTRSRIQNQTGKKGAVGFRMPRQGAARVILVGGPNSGKTSLFNRLSESNREVAEYPFTTTQPHPALMTLEEIKVQLVDTPPEGNSDLDPRTESLVRGADLVLILIDAEAVDGFEFFLNCYQSFQNSRTRLGTENRIDENDVGVTYTRSMLVWTKCDSEDSRDNLPLFKELIEDQLGNDFLPGTMTSAKMETGLNDLRKSTFTHLDLIRVYTRNPDDKNARLEDPFGLPRGSTVLDLAETVHDDLAKNFYQARAWGNGKHDATIVNRDYILEDRDVIEIRTR